MGLLVSGKWVDQWYDTDSKGGEFIRKDSQFRDIISPNGRFKPEKNRYHLYISHACPWAHRTAIFRKLKGLEDFVSLSIVNHAMLENGWEFGGKGTEDHLFGSDFMYQVYLKADSSYSGRVTVPLLWDKSESAIVNNESSEIIRIFNSAFDGVGAKPGDYYPEALRSEIDEVNDRIYDTINNGVYKCGFATQKDPYVHAYIELFDSLDWVESRLQGQDYLVGNTLTEADIRLLTTLLRFDAVYYSHFKCNKKRIMDYPNLSAFIERLYNLPGLKETVNMHHIKHHYYGSHKTINPSGIVPMGPELPWL